MIIGRRLAKLDEYVTLPRTGRGTPLSSTARTAVWEAYEDYVQRMGRQRLTFWPELRRDALLVLEDGRANLRYDAVIVDEAQDIGPATVRMLTEISGGQPSPNLTLVGDGQQAIYPGGYSLLQMGLDVRGRSTLLRTNWRNTYAIWMAAQAFIGTEQFDDLEEDVSVGRPSDEQPLPMRDGVSPGLWVAEDGDEAALAAEIVREAVKDLGVDAGDVAALAPTNAQTTALTSALRAAGVETRELAKYEGVHEPYVRVGTFHRAKVYKSTANTSTQKNLILAQTADSMTVSAGKTLQLIGKSDGTANSTVTSGTLGGYDVNVAGTINNANYFKFSYLKQVGAGTADGGINLQSGATVTDLSNGIFDNGLNSAAGGGTDDSYVHVDSSLVGTLTPIQRVLR